MAFVSRAERKLDYTNNAATNVGPGAYMGHSQYRSSKGYAPFSSTTERDIHKVFGQNNAPGPGSYSNPELQATSVSKTQQSTDQWGQPKPSGPFASKNERFKAKKGDLAPGPGSYNLGADWGSQKRIQQKQEWTAINWMRIPSAPSIPAQHQAFGYDETSNGELIMQKNPEKVYEGTVKDSVGPGQYNARDPREVFVSKGTAWHKSQSKRDLYSAPPTGTLIGPGSYSESKLNIAPMYKFKPSAAFASVTKRTSYIPDPGRQTSTDENDESEDEGGDEGIPGPGYYYNEENITSFKPSKIPRNLQYFGSKSIRFKSQGPPSSLGPGYYGDLRKPIAQKRPGDSKAPFSSTKTRFQHSVDPNPGPGSYKNNDIGENLQKKVWGRQGVFGSTERRFAPSKNQETPGPGYYPPDAHNRIGLHNSALHKPSSVFTSKAARDAQLKSTETPAPGTYDIPSSIGAKRSPTSPTHPLLTHINEVSKKNVGFNSQADRFRQNQEAIKDPLGPGTYDVVEPRRGAHAIPNKVFIARADRFNEEKKPAELPGPGAYYEEHNEETWNKRSFNILFSELT